MKGDGVLSQIGSSVCGASNENVRLVGRGVTGPTGPLVVIEGDKPFETDKNLRPSCVRSRPNTDQNHLRPDTSRLGGTTTSKARRNLQNLYLESGRKDSIRS